MPDDVRVVFDGDIAPLSRKVALAKAEVQSLGNTTETLKFDAGERSLARMAAATREINASLSTGPTFATKYAPALSDLEKRAANVSKGFKEITQTKIDSGQFSGLTAGATKTELEVKALTGQILAMKATTQTTDPGLFKIYQADLTALEKQLALYEVELGSIIKLQREAALESRAVTSGGGVGAQPLRGYGGLFRATGLTNAGVNEAEANVAIRGAAALGLGTEILAIGGSIAALGLGLVLTSEKLKTLADSRLASEEQIAGAINKQVTSLREAVSDYERFKINLQDVKRFTGDVGEAIQTKDRQAIKDLQVKTEADNQAKIVEINRLQANLATEERILKLDEARKPNTILPGGPTPSQLRQAVGQDNAAIEQTKRRLAEVQADFDKGKARISDLDKAQDDITKAQNKAFSDAGEAQLKSAEQARKFEEEKARKFAEQVKEGIEKVKEAVKGYRTVFDGIFAAADPTNPFVTLFSDADKKLTEFRKNTQGLDEDLKRLGESKLRLESDAKLFSARLDVSLEADNLRSLADKFRLKIGPTDRAAETDQAFEGRLKLAYLKAGGSSADFQTKTVEQLAASLPGFQRYKGTFEGTQFQLQRQLDAIDKIPVLNEAERNIAERRLLSVASSLDPIKLTDSQRNRVATTAEHQALVIEQREIEALKVQKESLEVTKRIDENQKRLLDIAQKGGINAVKTELTVKDETKTGVRVEQRPAAAKQQDVNSTFLDQADKR